MPQSLLLIAPPEATEVQITLGGPDSCPAIRASADIDHKLAVSLAGLDDTMCVAHRFQTEAARIKPGHQLAGFRKARGFPQDVAVMNATFTRQQRRQREDARIGRRLERQRGQRMCAPAQAACPADEPAEPGDMARLSSGLATAAKAEGVPGCRHPGRGQGLISFLASAASPAPSQNASA